jgi:putative ABC transport system substrate-binding protein
MRTSTAPRKEIALFTRRAVLIGLAVQSVQSGLVSHAATSSTARRIGLLSWSDPRDEFAFERSFLTALSKRGWSAGTNITITRLYAEENADRLVALARELVRSQMDVIVTGGNLTAIAAARATGSIPIVFSASLPFAVEQGLIESFARPGHNVTGAGTDSELVIKRLEYLKQLVPSAKRLAWFHPDALAFVETVSGVRVDIRSVLSKIARKAGLETRFFTTRRDKDIPAMFADIDAWDAHVLTASISMKDQPRRLAEMAFHRKLPSAFPVREGVDAGGLLSYAPLGAGDQYFGERAAEYVDRILRGAQPATLPVEFATRYEFLINARTAEHFGLSIPPSLLLMAELVR